MIKSNPPSTYGRQLTVGAIKKCYNQVHIFPLKKYSTQSLCLNVDILLFLLNQKTALSPHDGEHSGKDGELLLVRLDVVHPELVHVGVEPKLVHFVIQAELEHHQEGSSSSNCSTAVHQYTFSPAFKVCFQQHPAPCNPPGIAWSLNLAPQMSSFPIHKHIPAECL